MASLLIVDDDDACCRALARLLTMDGHEVAWVTTAPEALATGRTKEPDILICDWLLKKGPDGANVARSLLDICPQMRIVFITGLPTDELRQETKDLPVIDILPKPLGLDGLLNLVGEAIRSC